MPNVITFLKNAIKGNNGNLINAVGTTLDKLITNKEEKLLAENEIKKTILDYELKFSENEIKETEQYLKAVENARNREIEISKSEHSSWLSKNTNSLLALCTVFLTFVLFYIMVFTKMVTPERKELFIYILGVLSTICAGIFNYYFGSSKSSNEKSEQLNKMIDKKN